MAGRPPKPTSLKLLQGKPGHRKLPKNEPKPEIGAAPPAWLGKRARVRWNLLAPQLTKLRVLTEVDAEALGMLCTLLVEFNVQARRGVISSRLASEVRQYLGRFGMTPSDRAKVQTVPEGEKDPFEVFLGGKAGAK